MVSSTGADETERVGGAGTRVLDGCGPIDGAILKKGSPTCGPARVKIYGANGMPLQAGVGLFAAAVAARLPDVAVEDEGRLQDEFLRDSFLARVFTHARLRALFSREWRGADLVSFHTAHKLLLMAHSPRAYRELGRLVASRGDHPRETFSPIYTSAVFEALAATASRGRHANVLQHMAGYVSDRLDREERRELHDAIGDYADGLEPLGTPRALLRHYVRRFGIDYLKAQTYLEPYPRELSTAV
jgi:uncharacterized protein YbgA (DUF1722 family)